VRKIFVFAIKGYQKLISPLLTPRCKYYPSCSTYAELAITEFGIKGLFMATWRLIRCNPFSHGGVDYPSKQAVLTVKERQLI
jgi:putative membrane protein insertion efficiency factor